MTSIVVRAIVAFAATNIDDILILTLFFGQKNLKSSRIVLGQYLGVGSLVVVSLLGFFARFVIPPSWIGLLGLAPIAIGVKKLVDLKSQQDPEADQAAVGSAMTVAAVTFANGGDNIAVYVPLFANSDRSAAFITIVVFVVMIGLWCAAGYYIGNHRLVRIAIDKYGHLLVPFVLIALGLYIILSSRS